MRTNDDAGGVIFLKYKQDGICVILPLAGKHLFRVQMKQRVDRRRSRVRLNVSPCPKLAHHELIAVTDHTNRVDKTNKGGGSRWNLDVFTPQRGGSTMSRCCVGHQDQLGVKCLAQGHMDMWNGEAGNQTTATPMSPRLSKSSQM